jgi:hypothetical protein
MLDRLSLGSKSSTTLDPVATTSKSIVNLSTPRSPSTDDGWLINLGKRRNYVNCFVCFPKDDHPFTQSLAA